MVFIHIPKTAGLTLRAILANHFHCDEIYPNPNEVFGPHRCSLEELAKYRLFNGHYVYSIGERLRNPHYVTMLRDPVSRIISLYGYVVSNPTSLLHELIISRQMTLEEFLEHPAMARAHSNWQTGFIASAPLEELASVHRKYSTPDFENDTTLSSLYPNLGLDVARARLRETAMFGLCERFDESLLLLAYTFGWKPAKRYQSFNIAEKSKLPEQLAPATVERIISRDADDVALYEFGRSLFDERFKQMCEELLELYGEAEHARLTLPIPNSIVEELVEKHYRKRSREQTSTRRSFVWDMGGPVAGNGWHPAERRPSSGYARWTGPDTTSTMEVRLAAGTDYSIEFDVCHALEYENLDSIELMVNGTRVELDPIPPADSLAASYRSIIPRGVVGESGDPVVVEWHVARTGLARERDPANLDPRRLGIMLCGVRIEEVP